MKVRQPNVLLHIHRQQTFAVDGFATVLESAGAEVFEATFVENLGEPDTGVLHFLASVGILRQFPESIILGKQSDRS